MSMVGRAGIHQQLVSVVLLGDTSIFNPLQERIRTGD